MTNCGRTVRDSAMVTMGSVQETTIALSNGTIDDPFTQNGGPKCTPRDVSNFEWPYGLRDPLLFGSRVGFAGSVDQMALFPVR